MMKENNKYLNKATSLQRNIIGVYINDSLSDFLKESDDFSDPPKLKDNIDKESLFSNLINVFDKSSASDINGFSKLKELLHETDKSNLHDRRYDNREITQKDVAIETAKQLDELFDYKPYLEKNFIKITHELFDDKDIKLSQMQKDRVEIERVERDTRRFQERLENERNIRNHMQRELTAKSVMVGIAFGTFVGCLSGLDVGEDGESVDGFDTRIAFITAMASAVVAGGSFYGGHSIHQRRLLAQREQRAQNQNADALEMV